MNLPKLKFASIPLSIETNWLYYFLFKDEWNWGKYVIKKHPKIKKVFSFKTKQEQIGFLKKYIVKFGKENKRAIVENKAKYLKEWRKKEKAFFKLLSEIIGISWPENRKTIKAMMSIDPICPRFLNDWSFSIFYNYDKINDVMETIMHECCHFLYFEKWRELHPKMSVKRFESPNIEWHLSEIAAPIVLNDERIQNLLNKKAFFYSEYWKMKINKQCVPDYFADLYKTNIKKENGFEMFLKEAYKEIKINEKILYELQ